jgi:hypothetical protein
MRRPVEAMAKGSSQSEQVFIVDRSILARLKNTKQWGFSSLLFTIGDNMMSP